MLTLLAQEPLHPSHTTSNMGIAMMFGFCLLVALAAVAWRIWLMRAGK